MTSERTPPDADGFRQLWPVLLLQRSLPGCDQANPLLQTLIEARETHNPDLTTDYVDQNLFALDEAPIVWLGQCVHKTAIDYCRRAGVDYPVDWSLQGWANINRLGDYHDPHNHPHAYLSGTYYVRVPTTRTDLHNRTDLRPGCITFYDPRTAVNMSAIRGDAQVEPELTLTPVAGMILMWPAYLMHFVHPNLSNEQRVSISFNLMVKDIERHLPDQ